MTVTIDVPDETVTAFERTHRRLMAPEHFRAYFAGFLGAALYESLGPGAAKAFVEANGGTIETIEIARARWPGRK